ncbi:MAG: HEPN domain-containing protein [Bacteroidia bacterium]
MSEFLKDYIRYRMEKSAESFDAAKLLAEHGSWNACVNRLYYSCFYIVTALLLKNGLPTQTHSGVKVLFNFHFVRTGKLSQDFGKLYSDLMDWRHKGDYGDMFDFDKPTVEPMITQMDEFLSAIKKLIGNGDVSD